MAPASLLELLVVVVYDPPPPEGAFTLRGDGVGLSWSADVALARVGTSSNFTATLQYDAAQRAATPVVAMKALLDGAYAVGANVELRLSAAARSTIILKPWFGKQGGSLVVLHDNHESEGGMLPQGLPRQILAWCYSHNVMMSTLSRYVLLAVTRFSRSKYA